MIYDIAKKLTLERIAQETEQDVQLRVAGHLAVELLGRRIGERVSQHMWTYYNTTQSFGKGDAVALARAIVEEAKERGRLPMEES